MSRFLINEQIAQEAEEDLERLLLSKDKKAKLFNYSPFILRIVNELLLEKGFSIGLGKKTEKSLIDRYWIDIELPLQNDILIRVINGEKVDFSWSIFLFLKNRDIKELVWDAFYNIRKLKPRNNRIFRGSFSKFDEITVETILNQVKDIAEKNSLNYTIEKYNLNKQEKTIEDMKIELYLPPEFSFSCKFCNMCELPSHYSINPIPNKTKQHFQNLFSNKRIGYPANLACLSLSEGVNISSTTNLRIEQFCEPVMFSRNKEGVIVDYQLALIQEDGICKFLNRSNGMCKIHESKPLNCFSYPFLIQDFSEDHLSLELDFSCPGISPNGSPFINTFLDEILNRILKKDISLVEFNNVYALKWLFSDYFGDYERVLQQDVEEAFDYLKEKFSQYLET